MNSLKAGQTMMQWAGGLAVTLLIALSAALLNRTFTVSDQIAGLTGQTGTVGAKVEAVQTGLGEVKTELRGIRSDLTSVRVNSERIAAKVGAATEQPRALEELPPKE